MKYEVISADCHIDLIWLPPDLFTKAAPERLKERMPCVSRDDQGREVARGRSRYASGEVGRILGRSSPEVGRILGQPAVEVIHRDDLVLT